MNLKDKIIDTFNKYSIKISDEKAEKLAKFNEIMQNYNKIHNLTTITEENDVLYKHLLDSVLPVNLIPDNSRIIDIGCGAGFPSVPLAIMRDDINITALDSVGKKTTFVQLVKDELKLNNIQVINGRVEDIARDSKYRESYDIVVSRAVAPLRVIIEYSAPMLKDNGVIMAYKGSNYISELNESNNAMNKLNCKLLSTNEYPVSELETSRFVLILKKNGKISDIYPRKQNKPRLQPL